ncbi:cuticular protein 49Ab [Glossina fuscipes fuscipes]
MFFKLICLALLALMLLALTTITVTEAQGDGRYRPPSPKPAARPGSGDNGGGRYRPGGGAGDGRYKGGGDGRYRGGGDGKYRGGNDGRYVHKDVKYVHDDRPGGAYSGGVEPYKPDRNLQVTPAPAPPPPPPPPPPTRPPISDAEAKARAEETRRALDALVGISSKTLPQGKGTGEGRGGWTIIRLEDQMQKDGYHFLYETENGILAEENGKIEQLSSDEGLRSQGFYEYTGDDGLLYRVEYTADDNGFVPRGDHIPETPPSVIKLLAYLREKGQLQ